MKLFTINVTDDGQKYTINVDQIKFIEHGNDIGVIHFGGGFNMEVTNDVIDALMVFIGAKA